MHSVIGAILAVGLVLAGCGFGSVLPGSVDPACQSHADPSDCQDALDVALGDMTLQPDTFVISVEPIDCQDGQCTTWVSAVPHGEDCLPSYEVELGREGSGAWTVLMNTHGDPPCAFEP
jgi:hypothetical protein